MPNQELKTSPEKFAFTETMKWLLMSVTIFLIAATLAVFGVIFFNRAYAQRFFPGVKINNEKVKNLTPTEAINYWQAKVDDFAKNGLKYSLNGQIITVYTSSPTIDPDNSYNLADFDVTQTVNSAYEAGRNEKNATANILKQLKLLVIGENIPLNYNLNQEKFLEILKNKLAGYSSPMQEALPMVDDELNISITQETDGTTFNYEEILNETVKKIAQLDNSPLVINLMLAQPEIKKSLVPDFTVNQLKDILATSTLTLSYGDAKWKINRKIFKDWFIFVKKDDVIGLGLNREKIENYLTETVAPEIFKPVLDAKFSIKNGRVSEFQGSQDGLELDVKNSYEKIDQGFLQNKIANIELEVIKTKSQVRAGSLNNLGITQIIGTGHSNFKGSPKNRRTNIAVGAASLNGVLIKPDETFSLVKALGEIDAEHGYLPELVIKGDKTTPEFGGGLCQIGTTAFRTAFQSGLPIVERRNHSYRVVYYEPAGTDATIYDPSPDFKFLNDTGNYILIQTRIEKDDIYFDFWGTKDGRQIKIGDPVIYNIKSAGPVINIETDTLKPGEKKCTETAHAGADAYFDYEVIYSDGTDKKQRFTSHYIPWPAKCLIGKQPTPEITPTTTPEIAQ